MPNRHRNQRIMAMVASGMTYSEIGERLKISRQAVSGVVNRNRTTEPNPARTKGRLSVARKITDGIFIGTVREMAGLYNIRVGAAYSRGYKKLCGWKLVE